MSLVALGLNHKTAPIDLREQIHIGPDEHPAALCDLLKYTDVNEAVMLSTCNRTEIYCDNAHPEQLLAWLAQNQKLSFDLIEPHSYAHQSDDAVRHTMRVASGLDSMMLGEPEILGQMKRAYGLAFDAGAVGHHLHPWFEHVFAASKKIRTQTDIGVNPVSLAYAGIGLTKKVFENVSQCHVLFIGAGDTIELCGRYLQKMGVSHFTVANRTMERAESLAREFEGDSITIGDIPDYLAKSDIVISATACPLPFIGKGMVERVLKERNHRPMFMLDLAVPRDIEPEVGELENIFLHNIDDLQNIVTDGHSQRQTAALEAEQIIEAELLHYNQQQRAKSANKAIQGYRTHLSAIADRECERALQHLQQGKTAEDALTEFKHRLMNKLMHDPSHKIRDAGLQQRQDVLALIEHLYG